MRRPRSARAHVMHGFLRMAITHGQLLHDHAGARWLTPFAVAIFAVVAMIFFMLVYPHIG